MGTRMTPIPDLQGSVIGSLDAATGALFKAGYLPFGENMSTRNGAFRFTGRRLDANTASGAQPSGLYYYRARVYSPTLGRFLQPDPVGYAAGVNVYAYVQNDPLNAVDPSGRCGPLIANCVGGLLGGIAGGIGGGITAYNATGSWIVVIDGAGMGAVAGGIAEFAAPTAVGAAGEIGAAAGGSTGAAIGTVVGVIGTGAVGGAATAGAADYAISGFPNAKINPSRDITMGVVVGSLAAVPEALAIGMAAAATAGAEALGAATSGLLTAGTAVRSVLGAGATTCALGQGCGPTPTSLGK
jgi:RHS repeat-associated protein